MESQVTATKTTNKYGNVYILNKKIVIDLPHDSFLKFDKFNNKVVVVNNDEQFTQQFEYLFNAMHGMAV